MKIRQILISLVAAFAFSSSVFAGPSSQHSGAAAAHSLAGSAHAGAAVLSGTAAVAAVPLLVVGGSGQASTAAGEALLKKANQPLKIGHTIVHKTPSPADMMKRTDAGKQ